MRRRWSWLPAVLLALVACAPSGTLTRNQRILLEPAQAAEDGIAYA